MVMLVLQDPLDLLHARGHAVPPCGLAELKVEEPMPPSRFARGASGEEYVKGKVPAEQMDDGPNDGTLGEWHQTGGYFAGIRQVAA